MAMWKASFVPYECPPMSEFDTITITYIDEDDGAGGTDVPVTKEVFVDCTAPEITSVTTSAVHARDATIDVTTDEPVRLTIRYGTSCAALSNQAASFALDPAHSVTLTGLVDDTTYFFAVDVEDVDREGSAFEDGLERARGPRQANQDQRRVERDRSHGVRREPHGPAIGGSGRDDRDAGGEVAEHGAEVAGIEGGGVGNGRLAHRARHYAPAP